MNTRELNAFRELKKSVENNGNIPFAGTMLARAACLWPKKTALICQEKSITYQELYEKALEFTTQLIHDGVTKNDRVLLLWHNSIEFFIAYFGIWQTGAVVAPLNTFLHETELTHIINDALPAAIVVSPELFNKIKDTTSISRIYQNLSSSLTSIKTMPEITKRPEDLAVILYTSGTTGRPKGVMLSSKNIIINSTQGAARLGILPNERIFGALPLFHAFTQNCCVWGPILFGCTLIIVPKIERRSILGGLQHKPTIFLGVPALFGLLCLIKKAPLESIRYFISGSDMLHYKTRLYFEYLYGRKICNGYGLTETSPFISVNLDDVTTTIGNIGKPLPEIQVEIRNDEGKTLNNAQIGSVWIHGENIMLGYYNAPNVTNDIIKNDWLNTGDLGFIDTYGNIVLTGRSKDVIKHKGINIYPPEIENILTCHPLITQAAVVGIRAELEEHPVAFVATDSAIINEQELIAWCAKHLAPYKVPRKIIIMKSLPLTGTGKVDKKQLPIDTISL